MFSLNVPVPGEVKRLANDLGPELQAFESIREQHTLVLKRLGDEHPTTRMSDVRYALQGAPTVQARVQEMGVFSEPPTGKAPVLFFAVESPGLHRLHQRLVEALGAVDGIEGPNYTPHITLARGGTDLDTIRVASQVIDPITWTVTELTFYDGRTGERAGTISLPT